jgi:hypothetical protein
MLHNPELDGRFTERTILQVFEQLEPDLASFAEKHLLFVRKYVRDYPMWGFYFRHPIGGSGSVTLSFFRKEPGIGAAVAGEWHVDDDANLARSTYEVPLEYLTSAQPTLVVSALEDVLSRILAADASDRSITSRIIERRKDESGKPIYGEFERSLQIAK